MYFTEILNSMADFQNPRADEELVDNTSDELDANIFWDISSCSLVKKATIPLENQFGTGQRVACCIMPNGESVVCCDPEEAVYILNKDLSVKQRINLTDDPLADTDKGKTKHQPYQVAMLDNKSVVVSVPSAKLLQIISIMPTVELGREISLKYSGYELACHNTNIYVSTQNLNKWSAFVCGGIEILSDVGHVIKTIQLFETPERIFVQSDGNIIYQSGVNEYLKYVTKDGVITAKYPVSGFRSDSVFDKQGHVLQFDNDKICVRSIDGKQQKVVFQGDGSTLQYTSSSVHGKQLMRCCLFGDSYLRGYTELYNLDY